MQSVSIAAAEFEPGAIAQDDKILAIEVRQEFLDAVDINNGRAVNPKESLWIQLGLKSTHRFVQEVFFPAYVQAYIITGSFDPIDFIDVEKKNASGLFEHQAFGIGRRRSLLVALIAFEQGM